MPAHKSKARIFKNKKQGRNWPPNPDKRPVGGSEKTKSVRKTRMQERKDKEVENLYNRYQAQQYFANRGDWQKRPKNLQMTSAEIFSNTCTLLLLFGSVVGFVYSIMLIREANLGFRETEVNLYEKDEALWNNTYSDQLKNVNISLIQDTFLYDRNLNDIEIKEILLVQLNKQLNENAIGKNNQTILKQISEEQKVLKKLRAGQDLLKLPLNVKEEAFGNKSEAHLLNSYDSRGGLPEYDPYSLVAYGYTPLAHWQKVSGAGSTEMYQAVAPFEIPTTKEFKEMADQKNPKFKTISFEISEEVPKPGGGLKVQKQIINIDNQIFLKYYENRMLQKSRKRKEHCSYIHGDYEEKTHMCTQYYWAEEMCVSIAKSDVTGKWQLQGTHYNPNYWGCAHKPKDHPSYMLEWTDERNMKVVWQKMYMDSRHPKGQFFPLKFQPIEFHVRHAGDPLLAALNINRNLDFGMSGDDKRATGGVTLFISIIIFLCSLWRFKTVCFAEYDIFQNTSEALFEKDLKKYKKRMSKYKTNDSDEEENKGGTWKNPALWHDEPLPADDFHNLDDQEEVVEIHQPDEQESDEDDGSEDEDEDEGEDVDDQEADKEEEDQEIGEIGDGDRKKVIGQIEMQEI